MERQQRHEFNQKRVDYNLYKANDGVFMINIE